MIGTISRTIGSIDLGSQICEGIKWHDGTPFTSEDVKFTFERYRDGLPNRHTHHMSAVPKVDVIEAVDQLTVRLKCAYACPTMDRITLADLPILPKHIWETVENPLNYTELPVGTGPYKLVEIVGTYCSVMSAIRKSTGYPSMKIALPGI